MNPNLVSCPSTNCVGQLIKIGAPNVMIASVAETKADICAGDAEIQPKIEMEAGKVGI